MTLGMEVLKITLIVQKGIGLAEKPEGYKLIMSGCL
jgi:hypothetical protein